MEGHNKIAAGNTLLNNEQAMRCALKDKEEGRGEQDLRDIDGEYILVSVQWHLLCRRYPTDVRWYHDTGWATFPPGTTRKN